MFARGHGAEQGYAVSCLPPEDGQRSGPGFPSVLAFQSLALDLFKSSCLPSNLFNTPVVNMFHCRLSISGNHAAFTCTVKRVWDANWAADILICGLKYAVISGPYAQFQTCSWLSYDVTESRTGHRSGGNWPRGQNVNKATMKNNIFKR